MDAVRVDLVKDISTCLAEGVPRAHLVTFD